MLPNVFGLGDTGGVEDVENADDRIPFVVRPKLLDGYLLDALERLDGKPASGVRLGSFVEAVLAAPRRREPSVGLGEDVRVSAKGLVGSGLELDGELVQLSGYSTN